MLVLSAFSLIFAAPSCIACNHVLLTLTVLCSQGNCVMQIALDDVSLDDLWALDLNKLDGWRCIKENTTGDVKESLDSDNSSSVSNSDNDSA